MANWNKEEAIALAAQVEKVCVPAGCHVALTGGCLYKNGPRKDCDLLFYRVRQVEHIDQNALRELLSGIGIEIGEGRGWVYKGKFKGKSLDLLFPEERATRGLFSLTATSTTIEDYPRP